MDLRHLQTFKVIAEAGSFVQAAERLQYAQSTLTLQIQQLEAELGVELFDRQRRKSSLPPQDTHSSSTLSIYSIKSSKCSRISQTWQLARADRYA